MRPVACIKGIFLQHNMIILSSVLLLLLGSFLFAEDETPTLGRGFVVEISGRISEEPSVVISGRRSIVGSQTGYLSYSPFLRTDPTVLSFSPGQSYRVSFRYRIIAAPDRGFETLFYSPKGGAAGKWLPSNTVNGVAGDSEVAELRNTLGPYDDYQVRWNIVGTGAIAVDDIEIFDAEGNLLASEDAEPMPVHLAQAFLPSAKVGHPYWSAPAVTGGKPPYSWSATGRLPPGFTLSTDGELSGTPLAVGSFSTIAQVADSSGANSKLRLTINVVADSQSEEGITGTMANDGKATFRYDPYIPAFRNPLEGMRSGVQFARTHPWASLARQYIEWNLLENVQADTVDKIKQVTNRLIGDLPTYNIKVIPRVYLFWPPDREYWPSDLTPGDYTSPAFRSRMKRLIARLGEAWNNDPRIAFVEMGIIGYWGEHHDPDFGAIGVHPLPKDMEKEFADAFRAAFPDKLLMHRYPRDFVGYPFGIHWDVFGAFDQGFWGNDSSGMTAEMKKPAMINLWKVAPMGGEIDPMSLDEPDWSEDSFKDLVIRYSDRLVGLIRDLHWNHLAVLENVDTNNKTLVEKASLIQNALGYRFVIDQATYDCYTTPGGHIAIQLFVRNIGSSPLYYRWPLEIALLNPDNHRPIWNTVCHDVDPRSWLPATPITVSEEVSIPTDLPRGRYILALTILDPAGMVPAVRFAIKNYYNGGWVPIGPVGIGEDPIPLRLGDFDDIESDHSLYYLPTPSQYQEP